MGLFVKKQNLIVCFFLFFLMVCVLFELFMLFLFFVLFIEVRNVVYCFLMHGLGAGNFPK